MAEETEIINVGGEGVASEATLQLLLRAMQNRGGGSSDDESAKVQELYNKSQKDGLKIIDTEADKRDKNTKEVKKGSSALKKFSKALSDAAVSGLFGVFSSMKNMSAELMFGGENLSDFAQHIPIIGGHLSMLTGMIDDNLAAFRELSSVGARFGDGLNDIRAASAAAAMPLDEFVNLVSQNSMTMKMFGSDVASGALSFSKMSKELRDGPGKALMGLGFTSTELNELLVDYASLQAGSFTRDRIQGRISAQNAAAFAEQLNGLSAATGKRRDQIMEEIKAGQADIRIRAAMSRYTGEEGERFRANIGTVSGISKDLADALVDFDDGIPSNESTRRLMQMSDTFANFGDDVENMNPRELNNFVVDVRKDLEAFARANNTTVEELGKTIPGLESIFGIVGDTAHMSSQTLDEFKKIQDAAALEANRNEGLKALGETVRQFRGALLDAFIESDVLKVITESFDSVAVGLQEFIKSDAFKDGLKDLAETIKTFISNFQNFDLKTALFGGKATKDVFDKDGKKVTSKGDDVKGLFGGDGEFNVGEMFGNFISDAFASLLPSMDTVLVGIAAVLGTLLLTAVTGPFALIGIGIAAMFGWSKIKDLLAFGWDAITGVFTSIGEWFSTSKIKEKLGEAWDSVTGVFKGIGEWFSNTSIGEILTNAWNSVTAVFTGIGDWWSNFNFGEFVDNTLVYIWDKAGEAFTSIGEWFSNFSISETLNSMWETVTGFFSFGDTTGFSISGLISGAWDTIKGFFTWGEDTLGFSISGLLSTAWETVTSAFSFAGDAVYSIGGLLKDAWSTVTGFFNFGDIQIPSLKDMFQGILDTVKGFFTFDFKLPNFRSFLPKWLGGEGKSLDGDTTAQAPADPVVSAEDLESAAVAKDALVETQSALGQFANIEGLQNNLDILKSGLDTRSVRSYTDSMKQLVEVLGELNEELAKDNKFGIGTGENAGSVLAKMDSIGGGGASSEEVNNTLQLVLAELKTHTVKQSNIETNTRARGNDISRTIG